MPEGTIGTFEAPRSSPSEKKLIVLTKQQVDILNKRAQGLTNEKIAEQLSSAVITITTNMSKMTRMLGETETKGAIRKSIQLGIIDTAPFLDTDESDDMNNIHRAAIRAAKEKISAKATPDMPTEITIFIQENTGKDQITLPHLQALNLLQAGNSVEEIASQLQLSIHTVANLLSQSGRVLATPARSIAMIRGLRNGGVISLPSPSENTDLTTLQPDERNFLMQITKKY